MAAAARAQLGRGAPRRPGQPGGAHRAEQQRPLVGAVERRRLPAVEQLDHRVHVVDLDLAADVGAAEAELARAPAARGRRRAASGRRRSGPPPLVGGEPRAVPELDRERPLGDAGLDLAPQRGGACEAASAADLTYRQSPHWRASVPSVSIGRTCQTAGPLPSDIQPVANETRDRIITGLVTLIPFVALGLAGWQVWGERPALERRLPLRRACTCSPGSGSRSASTATSPIAAFKAKPWLHGLLAILGSAAIEGPVISWVADHRKHHAFSDEEGDPHSPHVDHGHGWSGAMRGLFHAHMGWLFIHTQRGNKERFAPDLIKDPIIKQYDGNQ